VFYELQSLVTKLAPSGECGETILVVEDQEATAQITRILLESWGYRVIEAHSGPEALGVFDERAQEIHLLLTDVIMPQMTGPELANELSRRKPELRIIFMSGYTDEENLQRGSAFLPKPFNPASLARVVRQQLRGISAL
jgi:two-component system cell cycle sensor histidine kinase/response regulator CckA